MKSEKAVQIKHAGIGTGRADADAAAQERISRVLERHDEIESIHAATEKDRDEGFAFRDRFHVSRGQANIGQRPQRIDPAVDRKRAG